MNTKTNDENGITKIKMIKFGSYPNVFLKFQLYTAINTKIFLSFNFV